MIVAIVEAAAAIAAIRNSEYAIHGAHRTPNAGTDRSANKPAHRTGGPVALVRALLRAAHNTLRMPELGDRQQCKSQRRTR